MARRLRTPHPITLPSFRIAVIELVEVEGTCFANHEVLFEADVTASYQDITRLTPPLSAKTTITCTLSASQGQQLWQNLKERHETCQECAWFFHFGPDHGTMCIGYLSEYVIWKEAEDRMTSTLTFVDSGRCEIPVRHVVTTSPSS